MKTALLPLGVQGNFVEALSGGEITTGAKPLSVDLAQCILPSSERTAIARRLVKSSHLSTAAVNDTPYPFSAVIHQIEAKWLSIGLIAKVMVRHQQVGREDIGLMFDIGFASIFSSMPPCRIRFGRTKSCGAGRSHKIG